MLRAFNMGVGLVMAVGAGDALRVTERISGAWIVGRIEPGSGGVRYVKG
jgi:phosphoribosylaminoimidazole (AIR) synthetase